MQGSHEALTLHVLLRRKPLFAPLTEEDFEALNEVLERRQLGPDEVLFQEGDQGDSMFIVGEGTLGVSVGQDVIGQLHVGDVTGEGACIDPAPRSATVKAHGKATVYELTQGGLRTILLLSPGTAAALVGGVIAQISARLRDTQQRIDEAMLQHQGLAISGVLPRADPGRADVAPTPTAYKGPLDLSALRATRSLSERDLEVLLAVAPPQCYPDQAVLCEEGRPGSTCFLIAQGHVEVLRELDGAQRLQAVLPAGALAGQVALVDRGPRSATMRARGDVVVLPLQREDFEKLLRARSPLALHFQEQVAVAAVRQLRTCTELLSALLLQLAAAPPSQRESHRQRLHYLRTSTAEWAMTAPGPGQRRLSTKPPR